MSTSVTKIKNKRLKKTLVGYSLLTIFFFVFSRIYESFSFEGTSLHMQVPLVGRVILVLLLKIMPNLGRLSLNLWNSAVAVLTAGTVFRGIVNLSGRSTTLDQPVFLWLWYNEVRKYLNLLENEGRTPMPRPRTKDELMLAFKENYEKFNLFISQLSEDELQTPFDFSRDQKKKEVHWKRDKNLRDVLIHLYEWQQLLLTWVHSNQKDLERPFLPEPYNWKNYGEMNVAFWKKRLDY